MNNKFKRIWLFQHIFEIWEYFPHNPSVVISYMLFETTALPDTIWHAFIALLVWHQSLYLRAVDLKRLEIVFTQQHHVCTVWLMNPNKVQGVVNAVNLLEFCMWGIVFEFSFRKSMQSRIPPSFFLTQTIGLAYGEYECLIHPFTSMSFIWFLTSWYSGPGMSTMSI